MDDWKYAVYGGNMEILADDMALHDALLFVKALYEDAYAEPGLAFIIRRNPPREVER